MVKSMAIASGFYPQLGSPDPQPELQVLKKLGFPGTPILNFVVEIESRDKNPLFQLPQRGVAKKLAQLPAQRLNVIVGALEFSQIDEVIQPGVVENLGARLDEKIANNCEIYPVCYAQGEETTA